MYQKGVNGGGGQQALLLLCNQPAMPHCITMIDCISSPATASELEVEAEEAGPIECVRRTNDLDVPHACIYVCMHACMSKCKFMYPWMHARTPAGFEIRRRARAAPQHLTQRSCDFGAPPSSWSRSQSLLSSQHATALPHHARLVRNGLDLNSKIRSHGQPRASATHW